MLLLWNLLLPSSPPQPLPCTTPANRCLSLLGLVPTVGLVALCLGWWEGTRPEGEDGFIYLFLSHASSRFCGGVKALAEALSPRTQQRGRSELHSAGSSVSFPLCCDTVWDGDTSASSRCLHIGFYALSEVTAALNENVL